MSASRLCFKRRLGFRYARAELTQNEYNRYKLKCWIKCDLRSWARKTHTESKSRTFHFAHSKSSSTMCISHLIQQKCCKLFSPQLFSLHYYIKARIFRQLHSLFSSCLLKIVLFVSVVTLHFGAIQHLPLLSSLNMKERTWIIL